MWSVWSKTVDLYLSASYSMLKCAREPAMVVVHPPTLPIDRVLIRIADAANAGATPRKRNALHGAKLRVVMGGSLCPLIQLQVPTGIKDWRELHALAQANAGQQLGLHPQQTVCEWDPHAASITSAMPLAWMHRLQDWAHSHHAKVVSVQPLWALATQSRQLQHSKVQALWLEEKDGVSLVSCKAPTAGRTPNEAAPHPGYHGVFLATTSDASLSDAATHWMAERGVAQSEIVKMTFNDMDKPALNGAPSRWHPHWGLA